MNVWLLNTIIFPIGIYYLFGIKCDLYLFIILIFHISYPYGLNEWYTSITYTYNNIWCRSHIVWEISRRSHIWWNSYASSPICYHSLPTMCITVILGYFDIRATVRHNANSPEYVAHAPPFPDGRSLSFGARPEMKITYRHFRPYEFDLWSEEMMGSFGGNDSHPMNRHACTHTKERDDETYGHIITHTYTQQIFVCPLDVCSYHFYLFVHDSPIFPPFIPPPPYEADVSKPITFHAAKSNVMRFKLF